MSTLETQYREYLRNNRGGFCSFEEWKEMHGNQIKQALIEMMEKELEYISKQEIKLEKIFNDEKRENIKKFIDEIKNPSQPNQALIDAAERYIAGDNYNRYYNDFIEGAKCQQERSYSEEEVLEIIRQYALEEHLITSSKPDIWFEQFKKK